jgi:ssDNA-binding Zn-finger/Zn-ribbon topoisomerase 1
MIEAESENKQETAVKPDVSEPQMEEKQQKPEAENLVCPRCGAPMVKRIAKKGANVGNEFYGCSNFPKCRCIIDIQ